jgi:hypothetical protein
LRLQKEQNAIKIKMKNIFRTDQYWPYYS